MAKYGRYDPRNKRRGANQQKHSIDSLRRNLKTQIDDERRQSTITTRDVEFIDEDDV